MFVLAWMLTGVTNFHEAAAVHANETNPTARRATERKSILDKFVDACSPAQVAVLNHFLAAFFFACRIPFFVLDNPFFRAFVIALRPAYGRVLPHSTWLRTTQLDSMYEETVEDVANALAKVPGKKTLGLDGKTNVQSRSTVNVTDMKQSVCSYVTTRYCRTREHTGAFHAELASEYLGDGKEYAAVVADNTGNMQKMFRILSGLFPFLFMLGCCVHIMDLLCEDIAKLDYISAVVAEFHFLVVFLKRHNLLYEAFLEAQEKHFAPGRFTTLKLFPLTRFAYCYLMVFIVLQNWAVIRDVPSLPEYNVVKKKATRIEGNRAADFARFERIVGTIDTRDKGTAVVELLRPISLALHYMEGDSVPASFIIPLYCVLATQMSMLPQSVVEHIPGETIAEAKAAVQLRWLGSTEKVGLRQNVHCLAFVLDPYVRSALSICLSPSQLSKIDRTYTDDNVFKAIKVYCGGPGAKYTQIVSEFMRYKARQAPYQHKLETVHELVKHLLNKEVLPTLSPDEKENKVLALIKVLSALEKVGSSMIFWQAMDAHTPEMVALSEMAVTVASIVPHACGVERANKSHGLVHCKTRASFGEVNMVKALYVYINMVLIQKLSMPFQQFQSTVMPRENTESADPLNIFGSAEDSDDEEPLLPAEREGALDSTSSDEESEDEMDDDLLQYEVPAGYIALPKPATLLSAVAGLYVFMLWNTGWCMGSVKKHITTRSRHNYDILWDDGVRGSQLSLGAYFVQPEEGDSAPLGAWVFMKKAPVA
jgi:hypothetical protein